jgi:uncharacterized protein (TIGR02145 family)
MRTLFLLSFLCSISVANSQTIENADFHAEGQAIVVNYDLNGCASNEKYSVSLVFISQNGETVLPKTVSGDLTNLVCGTKRIVWEVLKDRISFEGKYQVQVSVKLIPKMPTDQDGYAYKTVQIGDQEWFAENLRTTKYNDGTLIPNVTDANAWSTLSTGAYCFYDNKSSNNVIYGNLYNWYAVDTKKLCPVGWHVPAEKEWDNLINYLGGNNLAGREMKSTGLWAWAENCKALNSSQFSALPGGYRSPKGVFADIYFDCYFFCSNELNESGALYFHLYHSVYNAGKNSSSKGYGFSVRCIKD